MDELIWKQDAIDAMLGDKVEITNVIRAIGNERDFEVLNTTCDRHAEIIKALPTAQPKRGKWVEYDGDWLKTMCKCSECGAMIDINEKYRNFFCYHCGARMRGVGKEKEKQNEQY